jgi:hypothetical protein
MGSSRSFRRSARNVHRLAVDHKRVVAIAQRGLDDPRISTAPVVAVAGEQPQAVVLALNDQAVAVVLDFVDPFRPVRNLGAAGGDAGKVLRFEHGP